MTSGLLLSPRSFPTSVGLRRKPPFASPDESTNSHPEFADWDRLGPLLARIIPCAHAHNFPVAAAVAMALNQLVMATDNTAEQAPLVRDERGRFVRGSGNPRGRPVVIREVRGLAREHTEAAIAVLVSIAADRKAPPAARVGACTALLDRAWGRPEQAVALMGDGARDLPEDFVPSDGVGAVTLYEQLVFGLITTESALAAMDRAAAVGATTPHPPAPQPSP